MRIRISNRLVFATLIALATGGLLAARPYAPRFVLKGRMQDERGHQLIFSGNSKKLLASVKPANADLEQFQYVFDISTERIEFTLPEEPLPPIVCLSHDGKLLGAITVDDVAVWDLQQRSKVKSVAHVPAPIQRIFFGPGGELLGHNFNVQLWNMETKKLLNLWMEMGRPVGPGLVEFRDDQLVRFVDLVNEKEVGRLEMHFAIADKSRSYAHLDHSLDFRIVAADCRRAWGPNEYACFDTQNGTQFGFSDFRDVNGAAVSPDGQWYAPVVKGYVPKQSHFLGRWLDMIRREEPDRWCLLFFELPTGEFVERLPGVVYAKFSPDGQTLATISDEGHLQLWDFPLRRPWLRIMLGSLLAGTIGYVLVPRLRAWYSKAIAGITSRNCKS